MDRRVVVGTMISSSAVLGALFGWWLRGEPEAPAPVVLDPVEREAPPKRISPAPAPMRELEAPRAAPTEATTASTPHELALRAVTELTGDGVVRCNVGDTLPDGPVSGIDRGWVERGVLVGAVEVPQGQARIQLDDDLVSDAPRVVVRWTGAWPGEVGGCEAVRPARVAVTGTVIDAVGRPVGGVEVGNLVDGVVKAGPDGKFVAACWRGAECPLAARRSVAAGWGPFVTVVPDAPTADVVVVLDAPEPAVTLRGALEEWVAEGDRAEHQPDPLALALADEDLSADAREVIEQWMEEESERREMLRVALAEVSMVSMR